MKFDSKFNINQRVYYVGFDTESEVVACPACEGKGTIVLHDEKPRNCPECYGRRTKTVWHDKKWQILQGCTIGQVRAKVTNIKSDGDFDNVGHYVDGAETYEYEYMCYESGIDSGSIYKEERIFPSREEAQTYCDELNKQAA